jgi:MFS family permease
LAAASAPKAAAQAVGLALGPAVGGLLIALGGWRLLFVVNVPAGLLGMVAGWLLLPRSRGLAPRARFDWIGLGLVVPAVCALLLALSLGASGEFDLPVTAALAAAAVAAGAAFIWHERRVERPMLDLGLFRRRSFAAGVAAGMLAYLVLFGVLFVTPFFLEALRHESAATAGLTLAALPVALGLAAPLAGGLVDRLGSRTPTVAGMLVTAAGLLGLAAIVLAHGSTGLLVAALAAVGAGLGAFTPANNAAIMASAPTRQASMAGGVLNLTRGIGTSLGVTLTGLVFGLAAGHLTQAAPATRLVERGFVAAVVVLAATAVAAAGIAVFATTHAQPLPLASRLPRRRGRTAAERKPDTRARR